MKTVDYKGTKFIFLKDELSDYEMDELKGAEVVITDYEAGSYDGSGNLIATKEGKYFLHNCGHCSCNGPTYGFAFKDGYDSLEAIKASKEYEKEIEPLIQWFKDNK